jgi:hypothetical protein
MLSDANAEIMYKGTKTTSGTKNTKGIEKINKLRPKVHTFSFILTYESMLTTTTDLGGKHHDLFAFKNNKMLPLLKTVLQSQYVCLRAH